MSTVTIHVGSNLDVLPYRLSPNSVDAIVTDPPYELGFMGKSWDATGIAYNVELWKQCLRVLKPGGHLLAFSGSRTYHRMTCAIEDAGFEVRDQIMWVYGSGFPKSHNVGNKIEGWDGWGTALKPAHEPICVARKPLEGTVADNVMKWGTGAINVDGCRVGTEVETWPSTRSRPDGHSDIYTGKMRGRPSYTVSAGKPPAGRWPANLIHDGSEDVLELFPECKGATSNSQPPTNNGFTKGAKGLEKKPGFSDSGSAARFFYCPKASKKDRNEGCDNIEAKPFQTNQPYGSGADARAEGNSKGNPNNHPTVKPTDLMRYLCRLVTPPGGTVLDPFMGSGSTGRGAVLEGFDFIGVELSDEYAAIAKARIDAALRK